MGLQRLWKVEQEMVGRALQNLVMRGCGWWCCSLEEMMLDLAIFELAFGRVWSVAVPDRKPGTSAVASTEPVAVPGPNLHVEIRLDLDFSILNATPQLRFSRGTLPRPHLQSREDCSSRFCIFTHTPAALPQLVPGTNGFWCENGRPRRHHGWMQRLSPRYRPARVAYSTP